jgi:hypothetical protein
VQTSSRQPQSHRLNHAGDQDAPSRLMPSALYILETSRSLVSVDTVVPPHACCWTRGPRLWPVPRCIRMLQLLYIAMLQLHLTGHSSLQLVQVVSRLPLSRSEAVQLPRDQARDGRQARHLAPHRIHRRPRGSQLLRRALRVCLQAAD